MAAIGENELICDFAEYYHIYDFKALPARLAAVLAGGLRGDSRIRMKLEGRKITLQEEIHAAIFDRVNWLQWAKTEDGQKNKNIPKSLLSELTETENREKLEGYESGEDFIKAFKALTGGG